MKFIPYSNGLHRLKTKRKKNTNKLFEIIIFTMIMLIAFGALGQVIITKYTAENVKSRDSFVRVNNNQYHFNARGSGDYTVICDAALGSSKEQWNNLVKSLGIDFDGKLFMYDRSGYGFNDYEKMNIEEQARTLKMILKKSGQSSPYLLVGEEYGSLVMTAFAKLYPDDVEGMILINPLNVDYFDNDDYIKKYRKQKLRKSIEYRGSFLSLTAVLNKLKLTKNPTGIFDGFSDKDIEDFNAHRIGSHYNSAYYNELNNIIDFSDSNKANFQTKEMLKGKPLFIVSNKSKYKEQQEKLKALTDAANQNIIEISSDKDIISGDKSEVIANAVKEFSKKYSVKKKLESLR